jgi:tRNA-Thr(GGU) m(6)t(6)A37 methyltransferase TsaA
MREIKMTPIGRARTPFVEKAEAPRQPRAAEETRGTIELEAGYEDALSDIEGWSHLWILFYFDRTGAAWRPKVLPPRSTKRRGVFATRSPHRPNPIGLSLVELESVRGTTLHVRGIDLLDGTPILDIKPYVPYCDAREGARGGWLAEDPEPGWTVTWALRARAQLAWLCERGKNLEGDVARVLALGPQPHAYRRIRPDADGKTLRLAVKDWRVRFRTAGPRTLEVLDVFSGYRPRDLVTGTALEIALHREFAAHFGGTLEPDAALVHSPLR